MFITYLHWSNCFSYPDKLHTLDITTSTARQILGSNGAGKTSIAIILQEGLTGSNSFGKKKGDIPNRSGKGYFIEVEFIVGGKAYTITTERSSKLSVTLAENGEDISQHTATGTYKKVLEIIGMDKALLYNLIYQNSKSSVEFLVATDKGRKDYLTKVFNLDQYAEMRKRAASYLVLEKEALAEISAQVIKLETKRSLLGKQSELPVREEHVVPGVPDTLALKILEDKHAKYLRVKGEIEDALASIRRNKSLIKPVPLEPIKPDMEQVECTRVEYALVCDSLKKATLEVRSLDVDIKTHCPLCKQSVEYDAELKERRDLRLLDAKAEGRCLAVERDRLSVEIRREEAGIKAYVSALAKVSKVESNNLRYTEECDALASTVPELPEDVSDKLIEVTTDISRGMDYRDSIIRENGEIAEQNKRVEIASLELEEVLKNLVSTRAKRVEVESNVSSAETLREVFGTKGLISYKIDSLFTSLQEKINEYLSMFTDGRFQLRMVMEADKLSLSILDNGEDVPVVALSAGEFTRVNCAVLLAVRKLMGNLNILFLDELSGTLDEEGNEKLVEILIKEEGINSFIVSHSFEHPLLDKLVITKTDGYSEINTW